MSAAAMTERRLIERAQAEGLLPPEARAAWQDEAGPSWIITVLSFIGAQLVVAQGSQGDGTLDQGAGLVTVDLLQGRQWHLLPFGRQIQRLSATHAGIARGETQAELDAEWSGALPDFALERLAGALQFQVGPGQLLEINPGLGRLIGLFSVQNLSRRLSLDFSDLFQPGASFDRITGNVTFNRGQARLDQLTIEAPAAQVDIQGRVGLRDRDYDQQITVTPRLGGALPIAGALAGGPVTGAAVFVAEQLLRKGIEQATRYHYRLHGSWDDPVLEPLAEEIPHPTPRQGFMNDN